MLRAEINELNAHLTFVWKILSKNSIFVVKCSNGIYASQGMCGFGCVWNRLCWFVFECFLLVCPCVDLCV